VQWLRVKRTWPNVRRAKSEAARLAVPHHDSLVGTLRNGLKIVRPSVLAVFMFITSSYRLG
jgi:hypothetical protein